MIAESKTKYQNLATYQIHLRYPNFNLKSYVDYEKGGETIIEFETLIPSKNGKRLLPLREQYVMSGFEWRKLEEFKNRFLESCDLMIKEYAWNDENTVYEPYEINYI